MKMIPLSLLLIQLLSLSPAAHAAGVCDPRDGGTIESCLASDDKALLGMARIKQMGACWATEDWSNYCRYAAGPQHFPDYQVWVWSDFSKKWENFYSEWGGYYCNHSKSLRPGTPSTQAAALRRAVSIGVCGLKHAKVADSKQ